jgi:CRISPR system Cascade subunit CasC
MIGVVEYNGACYYRYANIDLEKLKENLGETNIDLLEATVAGFIKAMALALPTGMQNSFAAQTYPSYIEVVALDKPLSYANAFSKPVRGSEKHSIEEVSIEALKEYRNKIERFLGVKPVWREICSIFDDNDGSVPDLIEKVRKHLKES